MNFDNITESDYDLKHWLARAAIQLSFDDNFVKTGVPTKTDAMCWSGMALNIDDTRCAKDLQNLEEDYVEWQARSTEDKLEDFACDLKAEIQYFNRRIKKLEEEKAKVEKLIKGIEDCKYFGPDHVCVKEIALKNANKPLASVCKKLDELYTGLANTTVKETTFKEWKLDMHESYLTRIEERRTRAKEEQILNEKKKAWRETFKENMSHV